MIGYAGGYGVEDGHFLLFGFVYPMNNFFIGFFSWSFFIYISKLKGVFVGLV